MKGDNKDLFALPDRKTLKTYSHLAGKKAIPSDYELVSSQMLYYFQRGGFEVKTPIADWYQQFQNPEKLAGYAFETFSDPAQTTYMRYVQQQKEEELVIDRLFQHIEDTHYDESLKNAWVKAMLKLLGPLRYPWHGMQMTAAYLGSMAPEGKIVIALAMQSLNEMRRIQRLIQRVTMLEKAKACSVNYLSAWENDPHWQPLRAAIEKLLVTYDWLEGFVALNVCAKPLLDTLILEQLATVATQHGDPQLCQLLCALKKDSLWQQSWTHELFLLLLKSPAAFPFEKWINQWFSLFYQAILALKPILGAELIKLVDCLFVNFQVQFQSMQLVLEKNK